MTEITSCRATSYRIPCGAASSTALAFWCDNCGLLTTYACQPHGERLAAIAASRADQRRDHTDGTGRGCGGHKTVRFLEAVYLDDEPVPSGYDEFLRSL